MPEVFTIAPASSRPFWFFGVFGLLLVSLLLMFCYFAYSSRATRFEVSAAGLAIRGTLYGRTVPWSSLDPEQIRIVDLGAVPQLQPTLRTNGVGLPGYQAGWFRLRNGDRGLLFVTDPSRVVVVPTTEGYKLLMSSRDAAGLVRSLRAGAPHS